MITSVTEYRLKLAFSQFETRKDIFLLSHRFTKRKGIYTTEAFKDKYTNEVSHSHHTKIALPTEVLRWRAFIMRTTGNGPSRHGCFP